MSQTYTILHKETFRTIKRSLNHSVQTGDLPEYEAKEILRNESIELEEDPATRKEMEIRARQREAFDVEDAAKVERFHHEEVPEIVVPIDTSNIIDKEAEKRRLEAERLRLEKEKAELEAERARILREKEAAALQEKLKAEEQARLDALKAEQEKERVEVEDTQKRYDYNY